MPPRIDGMQHTPLRTGLFLYDYRSKFLDKNNEYYGSVVKAQIFERESVKRDAALQPSETEQPPTLEQFLSFVKDEIYTEDSETAGKQLVDVHCKQK